MRGFLKLDDFFDVAPFEAARRRLVEATRRRLVRDLLAWSVFLVAQGIDHGDLRPGDDEIGPPYP